MELPTPLVEEALRRINDPSRLTACGLIGRLPQTLANSSREAGHDIRLDPTPLEQARLLRNVLIEVMDRRSRQMPSRVAGQAKCFGTMCWPAGDPEGMSTRQIMARYGISESTLHRYRRDGVRVLAQELGEQEARFSRDTPDAATG